MPIKRCSEQSDNSLEDFYQEISEHTTYDRTGVGIAMLQFINTLNNVFKRAQLWGVTSHARLILHNGYDITLGGNVIISSAGFTFYTVEYLLPMIKRPCQNAKVTGEVDTLAQAMNYILIAMRESEEWVGTEELTELLAERNL